MQSLGDLHARSRSEAQVNGNVWLRTVGGLSVADERSNYLCQDLAGFGTTRPARETLQVRQVCTTPRHARTAAAEQSWDRWAGRGRSLVGGLAF